MIVDKDLQALDARLGRARDAYQSLRYEGSAPRPASARPRRRVAAFWAALSVPAAAAVLLLALHRDDADMPPGYAAPPSGSLNAVVEQRPLSWRSSLPEGRLAIAPASGNLSFSPPPRPRRPDETILLQDTSVTRRQTPTFG